MKKIQLAVLALAVCGVASADGLRKLSVDRNTCFLLGAKGGAATDLSGRISGIEAKGVEIVKDATFGEVLRFDGKAFVKIPDGGKIGFRDGLTIEAWVWFEQTVTNSIPFVGKAGTDWYTRSFETLIEPGNKPYVRCICCEGEKIDFTEDELKNHWRWKTAGNYAGPGGASHSRIGLPTGRWAHVSISYDRRRSLQRTWVDGVLDREVFNLHRVSDVLYDNDAYPVVVFGPKVRGVRLAQLKVSSRATNPGVSDPVSVFIHENAWRGKGYVHLKPVSDTLPVPVEVEVSDNPRGASRRAVARGTITSVTEPVNVDIPRSSLPCCKSIVSIVLKKDGVEFWRHEAVVRHATVIEPSMVAFYSGKGPYDRTVKPDWKILPDNTFTHLGKPILPLMLYGVRTENFDLVSSLGFNVLNIRRPKDVTKWDWLKIIEPYYAKAAEKGVTVTVADEEVSGRPGQGFKLLYDEPWAWSFEFFRLGFVEARSGREHPASLPIFVTQNNPTRYRETSMCCDVLAPDPYHKGTSAMRGIYDDIRAACADTDHLKPVLCIVGNYGKTDAGVPDREELRTMCYLGLTGGATALGFYSWTEDEIGGPMDTTTKPYQVESYRALLKEFKALEDPLTTPNLTDGAPTVEPARPRGFFVSAKRGRDRKLYLLVASDLYRSATKTVVFPLAKGKTAKLLFGPARTGQLAASEKLAFDASGKAALSLPPIASAVYVVNP